VFKQSDLSRLKNKTKQNKTKQNKTKQNKTKQNKTKQNKTKQNRTHTYKKNKQTNKQTKQQYVKTSSDKRLHTLHSSVLRTVIFVPEKPEFIQSEFELKSLLPPYILEHSSLPFKCSY